MGDLRFQRRLESPQSPNNLVIPAKAGTYRELLNINSRRILQTGFHLC